jgi:hypothetical protein
MENDRMTRIARIAITVLLGLAIADGALAAADRSPMQVALTTKATPAPATPPTPIAGAQDRSFALRVQDGRGAGAGQQIGQALDDGTPVFPIIATGDVSKFVEDTTRNAFTAWGLHLGDATNGTLAIRYTKLDVAHNNRAVGATYVGNVTIDYVLMNRQGRPVAKGEFAGTVDHYGKGRSVENVNEALAESLDGALTQLLGDADFRKAWATARDTPDTAKTETPAKPAARETPAKATADRGEDKATRSLEQRLRKLQTLRDNGTITQDEYDKRRSALLDEI